MTTPLLRPSPAGRRAPSLSSSGPSRNPPGTTCRTVAAPRRPRCSTWRRDWSLLGRERQHHSTRPGGAASARLRARGSNSAGQSADVVPSDQKSSQAPEDEDEDEDEGGKASDESRDAGRALKGASEPVGEHATPKQPHGEEEEESAWQYRRRMAGTLLAFMGPALTIPMADPLMSLVDTVVIGQFSSTVQLAGLAPVTLIFNFVNYMWTSQGISTTACVAAELNQPGRPRADAVAAASRVMSSSAFASVATGSAICIFLLAAAPLIVSITGAAPEITSVSLAYLRIRALATPAVFATIVIQASLMAQRNSAWPSLVIACSVLTNVALDLGLICGCGMGAVGAAWATVGSQYVALVLLLWIVQRRGEVKLRWLVPTEEDLGKFRGSTGSLALIYLVKNACYMAIQRTATALPVLSLAAHQPVFTLWSLCTFATTPLEQAAMAFLPAAKERLESRELPRLILSAGVAIGLLAGLVAAGIPVLVPAFFSPDASLYPAMRSIAPQVFFSLVLAGLEVASTGILLSKRDYEFMKGSTLRTLAVMVAIMAAVNIYGWGLAGVWWALVVFFGCRAAQSLPRALWSLRKQRREAGGDSGSAVPSPAGGQAPQPS